MEPERRCKSGMDGGLAAASLVSSPPLYLRTAVFLSNQPGPPHWSKEKGDHYRVILDAMRAKLEGKPKVEEIVGARGKGVVRGEDCQEEEAPGEWLYGQIWM